MSESVIADDLHVKGVITTSGDIEFKGTLEGEITCRTLLIAEDAKIDGKATAEKVVVRGTVDGQINGVRVTLTSSAKVKGELVCKALSVDEEAYFDGTSQRVNDPLGQGEGKSSAASESLASSTNSNAKSPDKSSSEKLQPLAASSGSVSGARASSGH